ncbi:hypothetical protein JHW43_004276, partial [Diplocarpon mali]
AIRKPCPVRTSWRAFVNGQVPRQKSHVICAEESGGGNARNEGLLRAGKSSCAWLARRNEPIPGSAGAAAVFGIPAVLYLPAVEVSKSRGCCCHVRTHAEPHRRISFHGAAQMRQNWYLHFLPLRCRWEE